MLFNSFTYLLFLPLVVFLYWVIPARFRTWLLLIASYIFYMNWIPGYGLLILVLTVVNYGLGLFISRSQYKKRLILTLGLIFNLSALCFFKYATFLVENIWLGTNFACQLVHISFPQLPTINWQQPTVNILLPLGISFFTFEFIHYIVDVYKGNQPISNFKDFALFAAFFPSQIAGPVKRYEDFVSQLKTPLSFKQTDFGGGIFLILQGLYKKIVLGDNMGPLVNYGFTHIHQLGLIETWLTVIGFTFQIFFDFSGYTDIGRGSAMLLGYKVPENFNWPYLAANLTDFWRRWHMSLSTWLRDYLFFPLGGSRVSSWLVRRNLLITMMLGGLWHGAAWHYVIWGAFHGLGLVISKDWHDFVSKFKLLSHWRTTKIWHCAGIVFTLFFIFIAGILFRAETLNDVWSLFCGMFIPASLAADSHNLLQLLYESTVPISLTTYCLFIGWRLILERQFSQNNLVGLHYILRLWQNSLPLRLSVCTSIALIILGLAPGKMMPFIYFQF